MKKIITLFACLYGINLPYGQDPILSFFQRFLDHRESFTSMNYHVDFRIKKFFSDSILYMEAQSKIVRKDSDTLFSGMILIDLDTVWLGYDGERLMRFDKAHGNLTYDLAAENSGLFIGSTMYVDLIDDGFLRKSKGLIQLYSDESVQKKIIDTIIDSKKCIGFHFTIPNGEEKPILYFGAIDTNEMVIKYKKITVFAEGLFEVKEWYYNDVKLGMATEIPELQINSVSDLIKMEKYQGKGSTEELKYSYNFSNLNGTILKSGSPISFQEQRSPFTILDFWYTSCYPCIKSIPQLNEIYAKYKDKGIRLYGVNMIDDLVKSKSKLDKFQTNYPMAYESIMADNSLEQELQLSGFPTLLILDKDLKIIYEEVGFNEHLFEEVSAFLDDRLK